MKMLETKTRLRIRVEKRTLRAKAARHCGGLVHCGGPKHWGGLKHCGGIRHCGG